MYNSCVKSVLCGGKALIENTLQNKGAVVAYLQETSQQVILTVYGAASQQIQTKMTFSRYPQC